MRHVLRLAILLLPVLAFSANLSSVTVSGLKRLLPSDVQNFLRLGNGRMVVTAELDRSCQALLDSGLFATCEFSYRQPANDDIQLDLKVTETAADREVEVFLASGQDAAGFWQWAAKNEPWIKKSMPSNDAAIAVYNAAIQRFLMAANSREKLSGTVEDDLEKRTMRFVFRPVNLASIADVNVAGSNAIAPAELEAALKKAAAGTPYTEFDLRETLSQTITPLFENAGYLGVAYPSIETQPAAGGVLVKVQIAEGKQYRVGAVQVQGLEGEEQKSAITAFPNSGIVDWSAFHAAAKDVVQKQKNRGYLEAGYSLKRTLQPEGTAEVSAAIELGPVFTFGELTITGLSRAVEDRVRAQWTLPRGAPMNEGYLDEFQEKAFSLLGKEFTRGSSNISIAPGTRVANVSVTFASGVGSKER